jgi:hypothetical protein
MKIPNKHVRLSICRKNDGVYNISSKQNLIIQPVTTQIIFASSLYFHKFHPHQYPNRHMSMKQISFGEVDTLKPCKEIPTSYRV